MDETKMVHQNIHRMCTLINILLLRPNNCSLFQKKIKKTFIWLVALMDNVE